MKQNNDSPKSKFVCLLLCVFLGWLGAHRFYTGKFGTAILMIFVTAGFSYLSVFGIPIWPFIDLVFILDGSFRDKDGRPVTRWATQFFPRGHR
ncbi:MAG: TM2 domain-containing protein [Candidatus Omnitrophica bacterium]|nr:TM2 domain-containing protein [Candidatus Omnitrophota bacterium]